MINMLTFSVIMSRSTIAFVLILCVLVEANATVRTKEVDSTGSLTGRVVYAVNAGGPEFTDSNGIHYKADPSQEGISSDYGKRLWTIDRVDPDDAPLYQTERYSLSTFSYNIPLKDDGDYVLVLKFSEVYFLNPKKKVFDVVLNKAHKIVEDLDIFANVGHGVAHDELIPFQVADKGKKLIVAGAESKINTKTHEVILEFVKGPLDNPKVNAFYVIQGTINDVPKLPPFEAKENADGEEHNEDELFSDSSEYLDTSDFDNSYDSEHDYEHTHTLSPAEKRRRRIIRQPPFKAVDVEENDWISYIQVGGSILFAILVAFGVKKILF